jgi:hypothetical protein
VVVVVAPRHECREQQPHAAVPNYPLYSKGGQFEVQYLLHFTPFRAFSGDAA